MDITQYIGLDIHKKSISICVKNAAGEILEQRRVPATWMSLEEWALRRTQPWVGALEATMFTGWVYDALTARGRAAGGVMGRSRCPRRSHDNLHLISQILGGVAC
jgi:transposase